MKEIAVKEGKPLDHSTSLEGYSGFFYDEESEGPSVDATWICYEDF